MREPKHQLLGKGPKAPPQWILVLASSPAERMPWFVFNCPSVLSVMSTLVHFSVG